MNLEKFIKDVPDFPKKGILFKDISPLLANGAALQHTISEIAKLAIKSDIIVGPDARGFIFGTPVAAKLAKPFIMVRKPGKLPGEVIKKTYDLEYGSTSLELQKDIVHAGQKAIVIDDVLATGGTLSAIVALLEEEKVIIDSIVVLLELSALNGRQLLESKGVKVHSLIKI